MLKILHQKSHNPYFNIATEEYLLKHSAEDFFIIYRNNPSIIVGKHQNAIAEINHQYVEANQIPVVRRLSGGGTVYHDLGNINFCFIMNGAAGQLVDFKKYTNPIIEILQVLGVDAHLSGKNDIRVGEKKISGNAEHIYRNRVLHHGTLLFNSDLDRLNSAIKVDLSKYHDNAVKSVRSTVANITEFLPSNVNVDFFEEILIGYVLSQFPLSEDYFLSETDIQTIQMMIDSKYSTWEWTYGYSPSYEVKNDIYVESGKLHVSVKVAKGYIEDLYVGNARGDFAISEKIKKMLIGKKHNKEEVELALSNKEIGDFFQNHLSIKIIPEYFL